MFLQGVEPFDADLQNAVLEASGTKLTNAATGWPHDRQVDTCL